MTATATATAVGPSPWAKAAVSWTRSLRADGLSERTITSYLGSLGKLADYASDIGPAGTDLDVIEGFFADLRTKPGRKGRPMAETSVHMAFRNLRVFFGWFTGRQQDLDPTFRNPMAAFKLRKPKHDPTDILTDDEILRMLKTCERVRTFDARRDYAIMRILFDAGIRVGELVGMNVDDLHLDQQAALIEKQTSKSRKKRMVTFGTRTAEAIDRYLFAREQRSASDSQALWLNVARTTGRMTTNGVAQMLKRRARQAGVSHVFPHKFRHSSFDANKRAGMDDGTLMQQFGWDSRLMLDVYGQSVAARRAHERIRKAAVGDRL
jgi:site-specific recombinase XerD